MRVELTLIKLKRQQTPKNTTVKIAPFHHFVNKNRQNLNTLSIRQISTFKVLRNRYSTTSKNTPILPSKNGITITTVVIRDAHKNLNTPTINSKCFSLIDIGIEYYN